MNLQWEPKNMAWGFYLHLDWRSFYIAFMVAGIDIEFHIDNVRNIAYPKETS